MKKQIGVFLLTMTLFAIPILFVQAAGTSGEQKSLGEAMEMMDGEKEMDMEKKDYYKKKWMHDKSKMYGDYSSKKMHAYWWGMKIIMLAFIFLILSLLIMCNHYMCLRIKQMKSTMKSKKK